MALWAPPADAVLAAGKPGKPSQARAIRDLSAALAERATSSPWINGIGEIEILYGFGDVLTDPIEKTGEKSYVGTWTVPDDVTRLEVTMIGGGGAGGKGDLNPPGPHAGGGGGAGALLKVIIAVSQGEVYSVILGAGGRTDYTDPSVNTTIDGFVQGDGARTTFGTLVAAGGKIGATGAAGGTGGAGGGTIDSQVPTIVGASGLDSPFLGILKSGRGAASYFGGGAGAISATGIGKPSFIAGAGGGSSIFGAGGSGGMSLSPGAVFDGGRGGNGGVLLRW